MKKIIAAFVLTSNIYLNFSFSQDCESIVAVCNSYLNGKKSKFVSDGQIYSAFIDREKAEFKTTFFGNNTYRVVASAGNEDVFVIFTVKDMLGNILFSNKNYKNSPYWDFKVPTTIPVLIETELDLEKKVTGCVVMLIGFKK